MTSQLVADSASGILSPSPALQRIWKRVELEWKACVKRGLQATVRISFLQLQGSSFRDLLSTGPPSAQIYLRDHDTTKSPHVSGADEVTVSSEEEMLECFQCGAKRLNTPVAGRSGQPEDLGSTSSRATDRAHVAESTLAASAAAKDTPESHFIFSFHVHLQGPLTAMPAQYVAHPKASKQSGSRRKARGPPKPVDEWIFRSVIRCVDVCIPAVPPHPCSPRSPSCIAPPRAQEALAAAVTPVHSPKGHGPKHPPATLESMQPQATLGQTAESPPPPGAGVEPGSVCDADSSAEQVRAAPPSAATVDSPRTPVDLARRPEDLDSHAETFTADEKQEPNGRDAADGGEADSGSVAFDGDSPGVDSNRKRTRDHLALTAPARLDKESVGEQDPGQRARPRHEVGTLVGLQTSARRLRQSLPSRSPVIMSLVTGAAARAPSLQLPAAADAAAEEQGAAERQSGVEALEGVMRARQQQKAMLPFRCALPSPVCGAVWRAFLCFGCVGRRSSGVGRVHVPAPAELRHLLVRCACIRYTPCPRSTLSRVGPWQWT